MPEVSPNFPNTRQQGGENQLLAIGFSCRALAESLVLTGYQTACVDAFGDADLQEYSHNSCVPEQWHEQDIIKAVENALPIQKTIIGRQADKAKHSLKVLFAGGIEQKPALHAFLHEEFGILGPNVDQVRALRNPAILGQMAEDADISMPPILRQLQPSPPKKTDGTATPNPAPKSKHGEWLMKNPDSSGGLGVCRQSEDLRLEQDVRTSYGQLFLQGRSLGITLILNSTTHSDSPCFCLGATESFSAANWPGPLEFIYRGSIGPVTLSPTQIEAINRFGAAVANELGYRGWLQIDLIEDEYENLWLLEANPRWTAGMEILHLCGLKPAAEHLDCFPELVDDLDNKESQFADRESSCPCYAAKAIVYAQADVELTEALLKRLWNLPRRNFCDIPSQRLKGTILEAGHPLLTVRETSSERMSVCEAVERLSGLKTLVQTTVESCS